MEVNQNEFVGTFSVTKGQVLKSPQINHNEKPNQTSDDAAAQAKLLSLVGHGKRHNQNKMFKTVPRHATENA